MTNKRREYTKEFKIEAIQLLRNSGKSAREIEDDLDIGKGVLYRWKRELSDTDIQAFPGKGTPRDKELAQLRKDLAIVKEERDILKKAVAIFSKTKR